MWWFFISMTYFFENICPKSNFAACIYWLKVKLGKSRFDEIAYACVNSIFYSMELTLISTGDFRQRFSYIVLRTFHYYFIFSLSLRKGFYYFTLITNLCFFSLAKHSTLLQFLILHGVLSYCYDITYGSKASGIFGHV